MVASAPVSLRYMLAIAGCGRSPRKIDASTEYKISTLTHMLTSDTECHVLGRPMTCRAVDRNPSELPGILGMINLADLHSRSIPRFYALALKVQSKHQRLQLRHEHLKERWLRLK